MFSIPERYKHKPCVYLVKTPVISKGLLKQKLKHIFKKKQALYDLISIYG